MQMPNGMNIPLLGRVRDPTPQEIMQIRNHLSREMAQATDDEIWRLVRSNQIQQQRINPEIGQKSQQPGQQLALNADSITRPVILLQHLQQQQQAQTQAQASQRQEYSRTTKQWLAASAGATGTPFPVEKD
jgi:hypothetical protein